MKSASWERRREAARVRTEKRSEAEAWVQLLLLWKCCCDDAMMEFTSASEVASMVAMGVSVAGLMTTMREELGAAWAPLTQFEMWGRADMVREAAALDF